MTSERPNNPDGSLRKKSSKATLGVGNARSHHHGSSTTGGIKKKKDDAVSMAEMLTEKLEILLSTNRPKAIRRKLKPGFAEREAKRLARDKKRREEAAAAMAKKEKIQIPAMDDKKHDARDDDNRRLYERGDRGVIVKKDLEISLCRTEAMATWRDVLTTHVKRRPDLTNIVSLSMRWCALQSAGCKQLMEGLQRACMHSLRELDLMGNEIGVNGTRAIAQFIAPSIDMDSFQVQQTRGHLQAMDAHPKKYPRSIMEALNLSYNVTSDAGCAYLGKALCICPTLQYLFLENCEIADKGCKYLRRGIERNSTLVELNLTANRFGDLGAREIGSWCVRNNHLKSMNISRNRLGSQRTQDIVKGVAKNTGLRELRMNMNRIGVRGCGVIAQMLRNNHTLKTLEISYNEVFNEGMKTLCLHGLAQNDGLTRLVLWYNGLDDDSARLLAKAMRKRLGLRRFRTDIESSIVYGFYSIGMGDHGFYDESRYKKRLFNSSGNENGSGSGGGGNPIGDPINSNDKVSRSKMTKYVFEDMAKNISGYLPTFMHFECDLSHNRRITHEGMQALWSVADAPNASIRGFKEQLISDRRERDEKAMLQSSLY